MLITVMQIYMKSILSVHGVLIVCFFFFIICCRNMQMLLSCLLRHDTYYEHLQQLWRIPEMKEISTTGQNMPSISRLQRAIEWAWKLGFDVQGCEQLGGRLHNTRKWIGATEVVALLSCLRLRYGIKALSYSFI